MRILTIIIYLLINNVTFANKPENNIDLTNHIRTNILKNGTYKWGDKEIGKESSFNVLRDINYLCYIEINCQKHRIMINSKFYNDTWKRVFGNAEKDTIENMIHKVYTKIANLNYVPQAKLNTLYYMEQLYNNITEDSFDRDKLLELINNIKEKDQNCTRYALSVIKKYSTIWDLQTFSSKVDIATLNCDKNLSIDGECIFSEEEKNQFGIMEKYTTLVDNAYSDIETAIGFKIHSYFKRSTTNGIVHRIENAIANQKMDEIKAKEMIQNWKDELIGLNNKYNPRQTDKDKKNVYIFCTQYIRSAVPRIVILVFNCKNHSQAQKKGMNILLCEEGNLPGIYQEESYNDVLYRLEDDNKYEYVHLMRIAGIYDNLYDYILRMSKLDQLQDI